MKRTSTKPGWASSSVASKSNYLGILSPQCRSKKSRPLVLFALAALLTVQGLVSAQQSSHWATTQVLIVGSGVTVSPDQQVVPPNVPTIVNTSIAGASGTFPPTYKVMGDLNDETGTVFPQSLILSTSPNNPFQIPGLPTVAKYYLKNIRLMDGSTQIASAVPSQVEIDVANVVITSVTTRPMTAEEIQASGIVLNTNDFKVFRCSIGLGLESRQVTIDVPMLFSASDPTRPPIILTKLSLPGPPPPPGIPLPTPRDNDILGNLDLEPVTITFDDPDDEQDVPGLNLSGILVYPNRITYLNQFFVVGLVVQNGAPTGSVLKLSDITANIHFPGGSNLQLRQTNPPGYLTSPLPIKNVGPDGAIGTADDIAVLTPGMQGMGEFDVTTNKSGTFPVNITFQGQLLGLPTGRPYAMSGQTTGVVVVRDPTFHVTFAHPSVVRQGDEYTVKVTVSNTTQGVDANMVSVSIGQVSGALPLSDAAVTLGTVHAGESKTAEFRFVARVTGQVTTTSTSSSDQGTATIALYTGVADAGIPLSPDTLVLPFLVRATMPGDVVDAALDFLGIGWSLATAPPDLRPPNMAPVSEGHVRFRAAELSTLARFASVSASSGYTLSNALSELALDWQGNSMDNIGFDGLRRLPPTQYGVSKGQAFANALGGHLVSQGQSLFEAHRGFVSATRILTPHFSAALDPAGTGTAPIFWIEDDKNRKCGDGDAGVIVRDIPWSESYPFGSGRLLVLGRTDASTSLTLHIDGQADGTVDLSVYASLSQGMTLARFQGIQVSAGSHATIAVAPNSDQLSLVSTVNGASTTIAPSSTELVPLPPLAPIGALRDESLDRSGRAVAVLFNRAVDQSSAEDLSHYTLDTRAVTGAFLQPDRRVVAVRVKSSLSPMKTNHITITGVTADGGASVMDPSTVTLAVAAPFTGQAGMVQGTVYGEDGAPLANAPVGLWEADADDLMGDPIEHETAQTFTDAEGGFLLDFVRITGKVFSLEATDPATGHKAMLKAALSVNGQTLTVALFMRARGSVKGTIYGPNGAPAVHALVTATEISTWEFGQAYTDYNGQYRIDKLPVGTIHVLAQSVDSNSAEASGVVAQPGDIATINLYLAPKQVGTITGTVVQGDGQQTPAAGYLVGIPGDRVLTYPTYTGIDGTFTLTGVPLLPSSSQYQIAVYDPQTYAMKIQAWIALTGPTANVGVLVIPATPAGGAGSVEGHLYTSAATGVDGATVYLTSQRGGMLAKVTTSGGGAFSFSDVPPATWNVTAYDPATHRTATGSVTVTAGIASGISLYLPGVGSVVGIVYRGDGTLAGPETTVRLDSNQAIQLHDGGQFSFTNVTVGWHQLVALVGDPATDVNKFDCFVSYEGQAVNATLHLLGHGDLRVHVQKKTTHEPLAALITLYTWQINQSGYFLESLVLSGYSDVQGNATFSGLLGNDVRLTAANGMDLGGSATASIHANQTTDVTMELDSPGSAEGTIFRADGVTSVPHASVTLKQYGMPDRTIAATTDGHYLFELITPGSVTVAVSDPQTGDIGQATGMVTSGQTLEMDVSLLGKGQVQCTVVEGDGQGGTIPAANVPVTLRGSPPLPTLTARTDLYGQFTLDDVTEGSYSVQAVDTSHQFPLAATVSLAVVNNQVNELTIHLADFGTVTGTLLMPDRVTPVSNAQVRLSIGENLGSFDGYAVTDSGGRFTIGYVLSGRGFYLVAFDPATGRSASTTGSVGGGQTADFTLHLAALGRIHGLVTEHDGTTPVPYARLHAEVACIGAINVTADDRGNYVFDGISECTYHYYVSATNAITGAQIYDYVFLTSPDQLDVTLNLSMPPIKEIRGYVYKHDGVTPAIGATVQFWTWQEHTNQSGFFDFVGKNVAPGDYTVLVWDANGKDGGTGRVHVPDSTDPAEITISEFGLGTVTGRVLTPAGVPVPGFMVNINDTNAWVGTSPVGADNDGQFTFTGMRGGNITLTAYPPNNGGDIRRGAATGTLEGDTGVPMVLDVILTPSVSIIGTVLKVDGNPVLGAGITLHTTDPVGNYTAGSDSSGHFRIPIVTLNQNATNPYTLWVAGPYGGHAKSAGTLSGDGAIVDLGNMTLDMVPPVIVSTSPVDNASNVDQSATLTATFSKPLDSATITNGTVWVVDTHGNGVYGTRTLSDDKYTVSFKPDGILYSGSNFIFILSHSIEDTNGNPLSAEVDVHFSVRDYFPPIYQIGDPPSGQRQVPVSVRPSLTFTEAMAPSSITPESFTIVPNGSTVSVPGTASIPDPVNEPNKVVFTPSPDLAPNTRYTMKVTGLTDLAGNVMNPPTWTSTFTTVDTSPPSVSIAAPSEVDSGQTLHLIISATDTLGVSRVDYTITGAIAKSGSQTYSGASPLEVTFDVWAQVPSNVADGGTIQVTATATDEIGNTSTPASATVTVYYTPSFSLTPSPNMPSLSYGRGGRVKVTANFTNTCDCTLSVAFSLDDQPLGTLDASPFEVWATLPESGDLATLSATATTGLGRSTTQQIQLHLQPSGKLVGHIYRPDGQTPVAGALIQLSRQSNYLPVLTTVVADEQGAYDTGYLPLGNWYLEAHKLDGTDGARVYARLYEEGASVTKDLTLLGTGTVSGRVVDGDSSGQPAIANAIVTLIGSSILPQTVNVSTGSDGTFTIPNVLVGSFQLQVKYPAPPHIVGAAINDVVSSPEETKYYDPLVLYATQAVVVAVSPVNGSSNVDQTTPVTITFSQPVRQTSLSQGILVESRDLPFESYSATSASWSLSANGKTATMSSPMVRAHMAYHIKVQSVVASSSRPVMPTEFSFTTKTPPQPVQITFIDPAQGTVLLTTTPPQDSRDIPAAVKIDVLFDKDVLSASVTDGLLVLQPYPSSGDPILGTVTLLSDNRTVEFTPGQDIPTDSSFMLEMQSGMADPEGNIWDSSLNLGVVYTILTRTLQPRILSPPDQGQVLDGAQGVSVRFISGGVSDHCEVLTTSITVNGSGQYQVTQQECGYPAEASVNLPVTNGQPVAVVETVSDPDNHAASASIALQSIPWAQGSETPYGSGFTALKSLAVSNGRAFVTDDQNQQVQVFSVDGSGLTAPQFLGSTYLPSWPVQIVASPGRLYVLSADKTLSVYDSGDPLNIVLLGQIAIPNCGGNCFPSHVAVSGGYAYVAGDKVLHVISVDNSSAPVEIRTLTYARAIADCQVDGNRMVVLTWQNYASGLSLYDLTDPGTPFLLTDNFSSVLSGVDSVRLEGNRLYAVDYYGRISVIGISDPSNLSLLGQVSENTDLSQCARYGPFLMAGYGSELLAVNTASPASPFSSGQVGVPSVRLGANGTSLVVASTSGLSLLKLDMTFGGSSLVITSPTDGALVSAGSMLSVTVAPNSGFTGSVDLWVNGEQVSTRAYAPYEFRYWVPSSATGALELEATLVDDTGQTVHSAPIHVTTSSSDVTPPIVSLLAPSAGSWIVGGDSAVRYLALDNVGVVATSVLINGTPAVTTSLDASSVLLGPLGRPFGSQVSLEVQVFDAAGNAGTSSPAVQTQALCDTQVTLQTMECNGGASGWAVGTAYIALASWNGIQLYDRSGSAVPVATETCGANKLALSGALAVAVSESCDWDYVAGTDGTSGILVLPGFDLSVDGNLVVTLSSVDDKRVARIYDISSPASSRLTSVIDMAPPQGSGELTGCWLSGPNLILQTTTCSGCTCNNLLFAYDLLDPGNPVLKGQTPGSFQGFIGSYLLIGPQGGGGCESKKEDEGGDTRLFTLTDDGALAYAGRTVSLGGISAFMGDRFGVGRDSASDVTQIWDLLSLTSPTLLYAGRPGGVVNSVWGQWGDPPRCRGNHVIGLASNCDNLGNCTASLRDLALVFGDTAPPAVSIQSPAEGTTVNTATRWWLVRAQASDDLGLAEVALYVDGTLVQTKTQGPWNFMVPLNTDLLGQSATIEVHAKDLSGNEASSGPRSIAFGTQAVGVRLSPSGSLTVPAGAWVDLVADALMVGGVDKVDFTLDGAVLFTATQKPYQFRLVTDASQAGHTLALDAVAHHGSQTISSAGTSGSLSIHVAASVPNSVLDIHDVMPGTWWIYLSPDGTLASLSNGADVSICQTGDWTRPLKVFSGKNWGAIRPDGETAVLESWDQGPPATNTITLVSLATGDSLGSYVIEEGSWNWWTLSPDGRTLPIVDGNLNMKLLDLDTMTVQSCCSLRGTFNEPNFGGAQFLPDGKTLIVLVGDSLPDGGWQSYLHRIDIQTGQWSDIPTLGWGDLYVTPDGTKVWMAGNPQQVFIVDLSTQQTTEVDNVPTVGSWRMAFHPGGAYCSAVDPDQFAVLDLDAASAAAIENHTLTMTCNPSQVFFEPHGRWSYVVGSDSKLYRLRIADADSWPPVLQATIPSEGGTIAPSGPVFIYPSEPMDLSTITNATVTVTVASAGALIGGTVQATHLGTVIKWAPSQALPSGSYVLTLAGLKDEAGNEMATKTVNFQVQ